MSRLKGGSGVIGTPSIRISPEVGRSNPAIIRSVVVFPEPRRAQEGQKLSRRDVEREIIDGGEGVEAFGEVVEWEDGGHGGRYRRCQVSVGAG